MATRARIAYGDLLFFENNIAAASSIAQRLKRLMYETDDPAILAEIAEMMRSANGIFVRNKAEMQAAKRAAKETA